MKSLERSRQGGFTLIELLTVIAIIAILASIIFPVMGTVRQRAQESHCISNLHNISQALGIYKLDERAFPPALGEYWEGNPPVRYSHLFPEYLKNRDALHCDGSIDPPITLPTVVPDTTQYTAGQAAICSNKPYDPTCVGAAYASDDDMDGSWEAAGGSVNSNGSPAYAYVLHYSRYRTTNPADPDYKRQMGWRNPPDDTVVTWLSDFRSYTANGPTAGSSDIVLFLNGTAEKRPSREVQKLGWHILPLSELDANGNPLY